MTLVERIDADLRAAMLARDRVTAEALRMIKAKVIEKRLAARLVEVDDAFVHRAIVEYRNQLTRMLQQYAGYGDRGFAHADQLVHEIGVCERFVPALLGEDAVRALVQAALDATHARDAAALVKHVMKAHHDRALGEDVERIAKQLLAE